jgi:hypothetical protein
MRGGKGVEPAAAALRAQLKRHTIALRDKPAAP